MSLSENKNQISPLSLAAMLTAARLFSLSLYIPQKAENAAVTAVTAALLCLLKLPLFAAAARLEKVCRQGAGQKAFSLCLALLSGLYIVLCTSAFTEMTSQAYPGRSTRLPTALVLTMICVYTASMGIKGTSRTASVMLAVFAAVCIPVLCEMRESMLTDRLDLFSPDPAGEVTRTSSGLLRLFCEPVIFAGFISGSGSDSDRTVKPYLAADALISGIFFLMCGAVSGTFFGDTGYALFALSSCSHGSIIDRANGIFTFFSSAFAILTISALMLVLRKSVKALISEKGSMMNGKEQTA